MSWMTIWFLPSLLAAFIFLVAAVFALDWAARSRERALLARLQLLPNALLSRWPIAFVSGPRSAFWRTNYWSFAPRFLAEHGYETLTFDLPWHRGARRENALRASLNALNGPCHLFFDAASAELAAVVATWRHPHTASITVTRSQPAADSFAGQGRARVPSVDALRPSMNAIYELSIEKPGQRESTLGGRLIRLGLRSHQLVTCLREPLSHTPRPEEIAAFDESLRIEFQFLAHAIALAENDCRR